MLSKIYIPIIFALALSLVVSFTYITYLRGELKVAQTKIVVLEQVVDEQSSSISNLVESCSSSLKAVEQAKKDVATVDSIIDEIKAELRVSLETPLGASKTPLEASVAGGDRGKPTERDLNGSKGLKSSLGNNTQQEDRYVLENIDEDHREDKANLNDRLSGSVISVLDKAYCAASKDSVYCNSK